MNGPPPGRMCLVLKPPLSAASSVLHLVSYALLWLLTSVTSKPIAVPLWVFSGPFDSPLGQSATAINLHFPLVTISSLPVDKVKLLIIYSECTYRIPP